ncbi:MAG: hypothetical protein EOO76_07080 [Novosphingobium sp.]|nr:MAG: hypothetical protein EOO76_07080 [Novosphingobium sp.]
MTSRAMPTTPMEAFFKSIPPTALRVLCSPRTLATVAQHLPFDCAAVLRYRSLPPLACVARDPVRRIGYTSFRGYYRSIKMGVRFPYESLLERDAMIVHDFHPWVRRFVAQPVTLLYKREGRRRRYTPDLLVEPYEARPFFLEVRPHERTPGRLGPLLPHIQEAVVAFGCEHHFMDEHTIRAEPFFGNCRRARRAARFLGDDHLLRLGEALDRFPPPVDLGDLCWAVGQDDALEQVLGLVALGILSMRIDEDIRCGMVVFKGSNW